MEEWEDVKDHCWAENTVKAYKSRWKKYYTFCEEYRFTPLPATLTMMCLYVTYLMRTVCYVTIANYISSVWVLHDKLGYAHIDPDSFLFQATMKGAKRILGSETRQVDPLMPSDMSAIFNCLDMTKWCDFTFWTAMCLCYRCLLRVSHISVSPHTIRAKDVVFWKGGMDLSIHSSKTIQYKERVQRIPVWESVGSNLCPVRLLRNYIQQAGLKGDDMLFPYSYKRFSDRLTLACKQASLKGDFASHSLRRGAATYLASFLPLHTVKQYGDWKSWAVLLYVSDNYRARIGKDRVVSNMWY